MFSSVTTAFLCTANLNSLDQVSCSCMKTLFCVKVEPQLKYERMSNDLASILSRDAASCLAVHSKVTN